MVLLCLLACPVLHCHIAIIISRTHTRERVALSDFFQFKIDASTNPEKIPSLPWVHGSPAYQKHPLCSIVEEERP
jgi:hypothetical protein